jgi:hypothetical protein
MRLLELLIMVAVEDCSPSAVGSANSHSQQPHMIKSLTALATFSLLGAVVVALPGFAARVETHEPVAPAKLDRLDIRPVTLNCSQQVWPDFDISCLRNNEPQGMIRVVRLVTVRR